MWKAHHSSPLRREATWVWNLPKDIFTEKTYSKSTPQKSNHTVQVREDSLHFYKFPKKNLEQRDLWIRAVFRKNPNGSDWQPGPSTLICSAHFVDNKKSVTRTHPSYLPTLFTTCNIKSAKKGKKCYYCMLYSRKSCSESGFWHANMKGLMPANIVFSFRAIKIWYSSNMWGQNFLKIRVN